MEIVNTWVKKHPKKLLVVGLFLGIVGVLLQMQGQSN